MIERHAESCTVMDMTPHDAQGIPNLVPIAEAAAQAGRATKTLRRWIAAGILSQYREPASGRIYVDPEEVAELTTPVPQSAHLSA